MARPLRIEFHGAHYHIFSRGTRKDNIFVEDRDRYIFLEKMEETAKKYNVFIHSYVLMNNHFHLYIETPQGNVTKAIHYLNTSYTNWFKAKYNIIGSIFQGRYKSILIEKESYAVTLSAYIHLNPVRADMVVQALDYKWSSYPAYLALVKKPCWLTTDLILNELSGNRKNYQKFVENWQILTDAGKTENMDGTHSILGTDNFENSIKSQIQKKYNKANFMEQPELRQFLSLDASKIMTALQEGFDISKEVFFLVKYKNIYRKLLIYSLKKYSSLSLLEIGSIMNMRYTAISENVRKLIHTSKENKNIKELIEKCDRILTRKTSHR